MQEQFTLLDPGRPSASYDELISLGGVSVRLGIRSLNLHFGRVRR